MNDRLIELVRRLARPRVLVVGDLILDEYVFGPVAAISHEAPVPILRADGHEERLGGAANVACMLARLGARPILAGVVGHDEPAGRVRRGLAAAGIDDALVLDDRGRPTTIKQRFLGRAHDRQPHQILRVDREDRSPLEGDLEAALIAGIEARLPGTAIVLVSDYAKGVCTPRLLRRVLDGARAAGRPVIIDPARGVEDESYHGATCLTPNRAEIQLATGMPATDPARALAAGAALRDRLGAEAVVVTLDRDGMVLAHADGRRRAFPAAPRQVCDITGAGDMVLCVLGLGLASGVDYEEAIALANVAGGLEVERLGVAPLSRADLIRDLAGPAPAPRGRRIGRLARAKVLRLEDLLVELERRRVQGDRIAFVSGWFDGLHAGHIRRLRRARRRGDVLVVGLRTGHADGPGPRPRHAAAARAEALAALGCVDYVVTFAEATPTQLLEAIRPRAEPPGDRPDDGPRTAERDADRSRRDECEGRVPSIGG